MHILLILFSLIQTKESSKNTLNINIAKTHFKIKIGKIQNFSKKIQDESLLKEIEFKKKRAKEIEFNKQQEIMKQEKIKKELFKQNKKHIKDLKEKTIKKDVKKIAYENVIAKKHCQDEKNEPNKQNFKEEKNSTNIKHFKEENNITRNKINNNIDEVIDHSKKQATFNNISDRTNEIIKNIQTHIHNHWYIPENLLNENISVKIKITFDKYGNILSYKTLNYQENENYKILLESVVQIFKNSEISPLPIENLKINSIIFNFNPTNLSN